MPIYQAINIFDLLKVIGTVTAIVISLYYFRLIFETVRINDQIERLFQERDQEIKEKTSTPGMTVPGVEAIRAAITEKYEKLIRPLIRKKGYIFDILPFVPKK